MYMGCSKTAEPDDATIGGRREAELTEPLQPGHRTGGCSSWGLHLQPLPARRSVSPSGALCQADRGDAGGKGKRQNCADMERPVNPPPFFPLEMMWSRAGSGRGG